MKAKMVAALLCMMVQLGWAQKTEIASDLLTKVEQVSSKLRVEPPNHMDPVSLNATLVWSTDRSQVAVIMKVVVLDGWHMYAYVPDTQPYIQTELELEFPVGIEPFGKWQEPNAKPYEGGVFIYKGDCVFVRYASAKKYKKGAVLSAGLNYQTCDAKKCLPPETKTISMVLK